LGFCVERHVIIQTFTPEPYWILSPEVKKSGFPPVRFEWERGRMFDKRVAGAFRQLIIQDGTLKVTSVVKKEVKRSRPTPMNTVQMLKTCSAALGIGPASAMHSAESLYLQVGVQSVFE
jgi:DNA topoisomerase-3